MYLEVQIISVAGDQLVRQLSLQELCTPDHNYGHQLNKGQQKSTRSPRQISARRQGVIYSMQSNGNDGYGRGTLYISAFPERSQKKNVNDEKSKIN